MTEEYHLMGTMYCNIEDETKTWCYVSGADLGMILNGLDKKEVEIHIKVIA